MATTLDDILVAMENRFDDIENKLGGSRNNSMFSQRTETREIPVRQKNYDNDLSNIKDLLCQVHDMIGRINVFLIRSTNPEKWDKMIVGLTPEDIEAEIMEILEGKSW